MFWVQHNNKWKKCLFRANRLCKSIINIVTMNTSCRTCLSSDRRVEPISQHNRNLFFILVPEIDKTENIVLCWECKVRLHHIQLFREKTQLSQSILNTHLKSITKEGGIVSHSSLAISKTEVYGYPTTDNLANFVTTCIHKQISDQNDTIRSKNAYTSKECSDQNVTIKPENKFSHQINLSNKKIRMKSIQAKRLKKHVKNIHDYFMCKVCGLIFKTRGKYEYHKEVHEAKPQCKECKQVFTNKSALWRHRNIIHNNTKIYSCEICKKQFFTEAGYQSHVANHPDSSIQYFCRPCGKFFKTNSSLRKHQRISKNHIDPEAWKYTCSQCNRKFPSEVLFKEHENMIHLNGKRFICKECPRQYCTKRSLRIHVKLKHRNVSQSKDNICEFCGKIFKASQVLKSHIRTHTGERPYPCSLCQARFTQSAALRTHTRLVHSNKK